MGIAPDQREYIRGTCKTSTNKYYGDRVPTLEKFKQMKRATFIARLEEVVNAAEWRKRIAEAREVKGRKQGVVTTLENNRNTKKAELEARQLQELAALKAKQEKEKADLIAHYEPEITKAKAELSESEQKLNEVVRASYYAGLGIEDDGTGYYRSYDIDEALKTRVGSFMDNNLMQDDDGKAVQQRINEEQILSDLAYFCKDVNDLRTKILQFISAGKVPPITIEAWGIVDGKDVLVV